jgi:hypothetical protein
MFTSCAACITSGNSFNCSLGADWGKGDKVDITVPVVASADAQGNLVNKAVVTDGNNTVMPEAPVQVIPVSGVSKFDRKCARLTA